MNFASPTLLVTRAVKECGATIRHCSSNVTKDFATTRTSLPQPRIDYKSISENVVFKSHNAFNRKAPLPVGTIKSAARLYAELRSLNNELNNKLAQRNKTSELVRTSSHDPMARLRVLEQAKALKTEVTALKGRLANIETDLLRAALSIPNDTHPDTPIGPESAATVLATYGRDPLPATPSRDHVRVARALDMIDLEAGSAVTGSSWYYLTNEGALLELALINYAVSVAMKHGYVPVVTPDVVKADIAARCGFQPRDPASNVQQMYHLAGEAGKDHPELVLSGTAEIPLGGLFANKVFERPQLPRKVVGMGRAFRAEAGARGTDTRGLYRVHQFSKVELFAVTSPEDSELLMENMLKVQIDILSGLGLTIRVLDMPTEELGASAYRKYDVEAWMPGRGSWGEVTSVSNCTDYQSRRLHIRCRPKEPKQQESTSSTERPSLPFAHTLNGTAAAIPRLIVALLENGVRLGSSEEVDGLDLPRALQPYWMGVSEGQTKISWT